MNLERAREVVNASPKTELGLAARLVLWELERREETEDPAPQLAVMAEEISSLNWDNKELNRQLAAKQAFLEASRARVDAEKDYAAGWQKVANDFEQLYRAEKDRDKSELDRLRQLESAVWEILDAPTTFTPTRSMQDKIRAHLLPHLAPRQ